MKVIHLSELHLGKLVIVFSMMDDHKYILKQILQRIDEEQPDVPLGVPSFHDRIHRCGIGPPGSTICPAAPH